ncbi:helix-turn-helix domain-containing protein [Sphaerotilus montanus]|uniref:helix-turn-helix domain-containing protein n=1 Tax=Sphaerotilus montanus TaxID=522889 RepID=UPI003FA1F0E8
MPARSCPRKKASRSCRRWTRSEGRSACATRGSKGREINPWRACRQLHLLSCAPPRHRTCQNSPPDAALPPLHPHGPRQAADLGRRTPEGLNRSTIAALSRETATRVDLSMIKALCKLFRRSVGELLAHVQAGAPTRPHAPSPATSLPCARTSTRRRICSARSFGIVTM